MLIRFFLTCRHYGLPVTVKELLVLLQGLQAGLAFADMDDFYRLSRMIMVKDESHFDRFDKAFAAFYEGLEALPDPFAGKAIPPEWLDAEFYKHLSEEEKAAIEALGGLDELLKTLQERLNEQEGMHRGGNKWIGTGGTSPFGHAGYNPNGVRVGGESRHRRAAKVWEQRQYKNLDDHIELGTRNLKMALRKLRQFARTGSAEELDMDDTIRSTAHNGGMLDIRMQPERHNAVKVLLLLDVGGSMDDHVKVCEELFSACRSEFKHLKSFYFHNFTYDALWTDNLLRRHQQMSLFDLLHTYGKDYKVIVVGDASMSPYEIAAPYGSIDFMNEEPGNVWFRRLSSHFKNLVWLNPVPEEHWPFTHSISMVQELVEDRMYPLTVDGLGRAIKSLV
ncbi:MAG: VWA domain-containing protein [Natronospirillum sp.]